MKNIIFIIAVVLSLSACKKDSEKIIGTWTVDRVISSSGATFSGESTKATFGNNGVLIISKGSSTIEYNYTAEKNVITINGSSRNYSCKKNTMEIDFPISKILDINESAKSYLSR